MITTNGTLPWSFVIQIFRNGANHIMENVIETKLLRFVF